MQNIIVATIFNDNHEFNNEYLNIDGTLIVQFICFKNGFVVINEYIYYLCLKFEIIGLLL
jgi:hypothetical protein